MVMVLPVRRRTRAMSMHRSQPLIQRLEDRRLLSAVVASLTTSGAPVGSIGPIVVPIEPVGPVQPIVPVSPILPINSGITALTITAQTGVKFDGAVANWVPVGKFPPATPGSLKAQAAIAWGDGTTSAATLVHDTTGVVHIDGAHTYAKAGTYTTTITVTEVPVPLPGGPVPLFIVEVGLATGKAIVTDNSNGGVTLTPTLNELFTATVAHLNFRAPAQSGVGVYVASINWGDGTPATTGKIANPAATGNAAVTGSHTYKKVGTYSIKVTVSYGPAAGSGAEFPTKIVEQITSTAIVVAPPPIISHGTGVTLDLTAGQPFSGSVGSFDYGSGADPAPAGLAATISWGDGTTSTGTLQGNGKTGYSVVGAHTYKNVGKYTIHVGVDLIPVAKPGQPLPQFIALIASFDSTAIVVVDTNNA